MMNLKDIRANITEKQLKFIDSLATQLSYGRQDVLEQATLVCGRLVTILDDLNKREASELIALLLSIKEMRG